MLDNQRHLDEQQSAFAKFGPEAPKHAEEIKVEILNLEERGTGVALVLRLEDTNDEDIPVARDHFVGVRFVKLLTNGTWHGGGDKFTDATLLGKILDRSLVNQSQGNEELRSLLKEKGFKFEEESQK